ncbi:MAG: hypothetical protein OXH96_15955 [Spirochaetaceae bacterium]|nr:hypothetical protein [Spirochaetaceae bacterium]MDE0448158.1 hypothetical protein [Spirochaetaceae bacterium]
MQYSVTLDLIDEPGFEGYYRIEGAVAAARDVAELWVAENHSRGEPVPQESGTRRH